MCIESVMLFNQLIFSSPLSLLPSIYPSIRIFSNGSALLIRWPKYWSFSLSISPPNEYSGLISFRMTGLISLLCKGLSRVFSSTTIEKHHFFGAQPSLWSSSHICTWLLEKPKLLLYKPLSAKWCLCFFNTPCRFVIAFLPRSKCLNFMTAVTVHSEFGSQENKICRCFHFSPFIFHEVMGLDAMTLVFWMVILSQVFHSPLSPSSRGSLVTLHFLPWEWYHLHIWNCWYFSQQSWFQLEIHPARPFTWCTLLIG